MSGRAFDAILEKDDRTRAAGVRLLFDPVEAFGGKRAPVRGTINGLAFRTTVIAMGGGSWLGFRQDQQRAAGVTWGDTVHIEVERDDEPREVEVPEDLAAALAADPEAKARFDALSFTHRRERAGFVAEAKRPETRARRIEETLQVLRRPRP